MKSKINILVFLFLVCLTALVPQSLVYGDEDNDTPDIRGIYIYDERDFLSPDSEVALGWYLWNLDLKTRYEMVLVFTREKFSEPEVIDWFNKHGVGKKKKDNGAALFVFPDNTMFMAIGSGNDKITVTKSKTYGEKIFVDFKDDPVLTLLRFFNKIGGDVDKSTLTGKLGDLGGTLWNNIDVVLLWALVLALILFLIQQYNGFQARDFVLPIAVFIIAMIVVGMANIGGGSKPSSYNSYGVITSTNKSSYTWTDIHTICTSTGKTTTCTSYPHIHTMYTNDVILLGYELNNYKYKFFSDESKWAWQRDIGEVERLKIGIEKGELRSVSPAGVGRDSRGITKGDGVWILAASQK